MKDREDKIKMDALLFVDALFLAPDLFQIKSKKQGIDYLYQIHKYLWTRFHYLYMNITNLYALERALNPDWLIDRHIDPNP